MKSFLKNRVKYVMILDLSAKNSNPFFEKFHLLKKSLTKLKKINGEYFNVSTADKVTETIKYLCIDKILSYIV